MEGRRASGRKMKNIFTLSTLTWIARIALAAVFIGASFYKIATPAEFAHQIYNYRILPPWAINPAANLIPWLQLFCGLGLLTRLFSRGASIWIVVLMAVFQIALASALFRGLNISCGCFKAGGSSATWMTFGRDFLILSLAVFTAWRLQRESR
jgi:uncharacterized membrane protein YphA (DoxX/SURF4 family)